VRLDHIGLKHRHDRLTADPAVQCMMADEGLEVV
jgi:hypothetical protein